MSMTEYGMGWGLGVESLMDLTALADGVNNGLEVGKESFSG